MAAVTIPDWPRGITFEQVWAGLMENREQLRENAEQQKKTDEQMKKTDEQMRETAEQVRENAEQQKKTDRLVKRLNKQMGGLHRRFGEMAEHLVAPGIAMRFNELGYHFDGVASGGYKILDEKGKSKTEVDILLENGECIIAVEVKATVNANDIEHHVKRLEILREHRLKKNDTRTIYGAVAGAIFGVVEKKATIDAGFYVLEQSGDTMRMDIPENFVPRMW